MELVSVNPEEQDMRPSTLVPRPEVSSGIFLWSFKELIGLLYSLNDRRKVSPQKRKLETWTSRLQHRLPM